MSEHDYAKRRGDQGTFAIDQKNGSTYGVPKANARAQLLVPFGKSPAEHDAFVLDYFRKCGIPAEQIGAVQGRMLLEATGRADEKEQAVPKVKAYYSVLQRVVDGIRVPDSFAWARANEKGEIVDEAVYWPALSRETLTSAQRLRDAWSDEYRRRELSARIHGDDPRTAVAIRHSAASSHDAFKEFASIDVYVSVAAPGPEQVPTASATSSLSHVSYIRHFNLEGTELQLPQELYGLARKYTARKPEAVDATARH